MLWAITTYFNPARYQNRISNYKIFRANLNVPLVAVEWSPTGQFELHRDDAEILLQITGGDILWQKERLLNVALGSLPRDCEQVAWIDGDVIFERQDWPEQVCRALRQFPLVQLFRERCNLSARSPIPPQGAPSCDALMLSIGSKISLGTACTDDFSDPNAPVRCSTAGLAWAAPRDLLDTHGLYDACILGSGDRAMLCAAMGYFDWGVEALRMHDRRTAHYFQWAKPFYNSVRGQVGFVEGKLFHLWHGDLENRKYRQRHDGLIKFDFDPFVDIALDTTGAWRWNQDKPQMHEYIKSYFESRKEDG